MQTSSPELDVVEDGEFGMISEMTEGEVQMHSPFPAVSKKAEIRLFVVGGELEMIGVFGFRGGDIVICSSWASTSSDWGRNRKYCMVNCKMKVKLLKRQIKTNLE